MCKSLWVPQQCNWGCHHCGVWHVIRLVAAKLAKECITLVVCGPVDQEQFFLVHLNHFSPNDTLSHPRNPLLAVLVPAVVSAVVCTDHALSVRVWYILCWTFHPLSSGYKGPFSIGIKRLQCGTFTCVTFLYVVLWNVRHLILVSAPLTVLKTPLSGPLLALTAIWQWYKTLILLIK